MTHKHTRAPWWTNSDGEIFPQGRIDECKIAATKCGFNSDLSDDEIQANARLIAAAPDLLEALEGLLGSKWLSIDYEHNRTPEAIDRRSKAISAIKKAKGE